MHAEISIIWAIAKQSIFNLAGKGDQVSEARGVRGHARPDQSEPLDDDCACYDVGLVAATNEPAEEASEARAWERTSTRNVAGPPSPQGPASSSSKVFAGDAYEWRDISVPDFRENQFATLIVLILT